MVIFLYPLSFLLLFIFIKQKKKNILFSGIIILYLLSALSGVYISKTHPVFQDIDISLIAVLYHLFFTILILWQFKRFDSCKFKTLPQIKDNRAFNIFILIVLTTCLISIFFSYQNVDFDVMMSDVQSLRALVNEGSQVTFIGYFVFLGKKYCFVALALAFYFIIHHPNKKLLISLLLLCSLTGVVSGLHVAAREYLVKYIYMFLIAYILCRKQIQFSWKRTLNKYFLLVFLFGGFLFLMISYIRFADYSATDGMDEIGNTQFSLLSYYGQGWVKFSEIFDTFQTPKTPIGAIHFPLFASESISSKNLNDVIMVDIYLNQFATALGTWMVDGGVIFAGFIAILFAGLFRFVSKINYTVFTLIYILWAYDFIFSYMFFFNETINFSRFVSLMIVIFYDYNERHTLKRSIKKSHV